MVVNYRAKSNAALDAALAGANASDPKDDAIDTFRDYIDLFNKHYETYGRQIELVDIEGTGDADRRQAGPRRRHRDRHRAQGVRLGRRAAPTTPSSRAHGSQGHVCICSVSQPQEFYESLGRPTPATPR